MSPSITHDVLKDRKSDIGTMNFIPLGDITPEQENWWRKYKEAQINFYKVERDGENQDD